ncbi:MAG TPA: alpha/beta hydrolase [Thermoanaerobaculia bacterium]|nr:alpha/beta hydrolase [Thermoanaerobaculia bacterium]
MSHPLSQPSLSEKSTIDRLRPIPFPGWLRAGFSLAGGFAPSATARVARRLFFTPPPSRMRPEQRDLLARAQRFELRTPDGPVVGWSWGQGDPVLLVHGWGGHAGQFAHFVEPLVAQGHRAVALDVPGHGSSGGSLSSLRHFATAIEKAGELFSPFSGMIAHSFGCAGATYAISRGLNIKKAVYLAPPAGWENFLGRMRRGLGWNDEVERRFRRMSETWLRIGFDEAEPRRLAPKIDLPLLVIHDRSDDEVPFEDGEELVGVWPGARLAVTEGLGHHKPLRDGATIARAVEFLGES